MYIFLLLSLTINACRDRRYSRRGEVYVVKRGITLVSIRILSARRDLGVADVTVD